MIAPETEEELAATIRAAHAVGMPLAIEGRGTKRGMLRPVQAERTLSTRALSGITLYRPTELVLSARAGTPVPEIEAALAEHGQQVIAEPPDIRHLFGVTEMASLGGVVSTNLSGPRRIARGAMRDHVLGIRAVTGTGEVFRSGGRVLKNVTGLDLCKLLTGAHGTLGVLTEITLKVFPKGETSGSLALHVNGLAAGVRALSAALGQPYGVTGAALLPTGHGALVGCVALLRIEDFEESVRYRLRRLREALATYGEPLLLEEGASVALWAAVRDVVPLGAGADEAIWRLSLAPSAAPAACAALQETFGAKLLLDWSGGLVWVAGPSTQSAHAAVMRAAGAGTFTLVRASDSLRSSVPVLPAEPAPLMEISARVKAVLDPAGILNPGRLRAA